MSRAVFEILRGEEVFGVSAGGGDRCGVDREQLTGVKLAGLRREERRLTICIDGGARETAR